MGEAGKQTAEVKPDVFFVVVVVTVLFTSFFKKALGKIMPMGENLDFYTTIC